MKYMKLLRFNMKRFDFGPRGHKRKQMNMFMINLLFEYAGNKHYIFCCSKFTLFIVAVSIKYISMLLFRITLLTKNL